MQKIVVRKLKLTGSDNNRDYIKAKTTPSSECAAFEELIQEEIDDGWKVFNVNSSYDIGWHCHVVIFVLEKDNEKE